jgi:hypothetical protein
MIDFVLKLEKPKSFKDWISILVTRISYLLEIFSTSTFLSPLPPFTYQYLFNIHQVAPLL